MAVLDTLPIYRQIRQFGLKKHEKVPVALANGA